MVRSSPLVPGNDPTLLFTNAGMVQFKDVFLGTEKRAYTRATSSQRCVRAGGKHNDLDQVGYTARHHTFFEMLGNFSFGDYFKREAIQFAWEFLTRTLGLAPERLWVTVFEDDDEAEKIWLEEIGMDPARCSRIGAKDNFWSMGDTGPCGPCSEIFYDHGPDVAGGPPGTAEEDGDRYIEIWNLVFMQFDRDADGNMVPLPKPCVDTGMGLERLAAILQGVHSNYEIDLFQHLIKAAAKLAETDDLEQKSLRVLADHIRACAFLIVDGVLPGREGRGYVLRRIIRRAVRHGHLLGINTVFFHALVAPLVEVMGAAYPELVAQQSHVERVLLQEEERFRVTLDKGLSLLESAVAELSGQCIPGELAFKLYDTHGFPVDLTADIARERGLTLDMDGFEANMAKQRKRAQNAQQFSAVETIGADLVADICATTFVGYEHVSMPNCRVLGLVKNNQRVARLEAGEHGVLFLDQTPFYAESGGQVGDQGRVDGSEGQAFRVQDTQKTPSGHYMHHGEMVAGCLTQGEPVTASVDAPRRANIVNHHSATHLMHAALREILGAHVQQKGSLVAPDRLRFDFSHFEPLTQAQIQAIEERVNAQIRANAAGDVREMAFDDAIDAGALAFFGDKYGDRVRVVRFGEFSTELCGGTHVQRVGDIGLFKITSEGGVASGVRRIEAVTGQHALDLVAKREAELREAAGLLRASEQDVVERVRQLLQHVNRVEKTLEEVKAQAVQEQSGDLVSQAIAIGEAKLLATEIQGANTGLLRKMVDRFRNQEPHGAAVLACVSDGKVSLVSGVGKSLLGRVHAGEMLNHVAEQLGGRGGGRPDMAQGGGNNPAALACALASIPDWLTDKIGP